MNDDIPDRIKHRKRKKTKLKKRKESASFSTPEDSDKGIRPCTVPHTPGKLFPIFTMGSSCKTKVLKSDKVINKQHHKSAMLLKDSINTCKQMTLSNKWGKITLKRPERADANPSMSKSGGQGRGGSKGKFIISDKRAGSSGSRS